MENIFRHKVYFESKILRIDFRFTEKFAFPQMKKTNKKNYLFEILLKINLFSKIVIGLMCRKKYF